MTPSEQAIVDAVHRLTEAADTYNRYRSTLAHDTEPDPSQTQPIAAAAAWLLHLATHLGHGRTVTNPHAGQPLDPSAPSVLRALLATATDAEATAIRAAAIRAGVLWQCENCDRHTAGSDACQRCGAARIPATGQR